MSSSQVDVAIIGAGPYGLSLAAHLGAKKVPFRIFGLPMCSWRNHMLPTTLLKSDGFASNLYDPQSSFTLARYCQDNGIPYQDVGLPVTIETFVAYGTEFQKRFAPNLEETDIVAVERIPGGFHLTTRSGETLQARRVVLAVGITHFGYVPPVLSDLPGELLTHSSQHTNVRDFEGRSVAVIGAGASAVDFAGVLNEGGAKVQLLARRSAIAFHEPSVEPRPLKERILQPRSGLGLGWKSRLCTDAPLLFHAMPAKVRMRAVERHLGPAPGWFAKRRFVGQVTPFLGTQLKKAAVKGDQVAIEFTQQDGTHKELQFDHVIAATGYKVSLERLGFLAPELRAQIKSLQNTPVLNSNFECSIPGLYMVGLASSNSFGPMCRFAYGAKFTSKRLTRHLAATA